MARGGEGRTAPAQEHHFANEIKIASACFNFLLPASRDRNGPGPIGSSAHCQLINNSIFLKFLPPLGDQWETVVGTIMVPSSAALQIYIIPSFLSAESGYSLWLVIVIFESVTF